MDINEARLKGRLTADPEARETRKGKPYCKMRLATSRKTKQDDGSWEESDQQYHDITVFGYQAEHCLDSFRKGSPVQVVGMIENSVVEQDDGSKKYFSGIKAWQVDYCESPSSNRGS